uniref:UTP4 small subunit processome component n=1 Tax=Myripristis murdjan TaxID=586833 RepID=A0A667ZTJ9_9TELE
MGEFKVHRVRFFDYMPSAIRAMAFNSRTERLALSRADGALEVFNFADSYFQEKVIPGQDGRAVEALCWVRGRLFSAGLNGEITEYDLENLRPKYTMEAYGGPVWTICSNSQGTHLAIGCEDGTVKIFEVLEETIRFQRNLDRQKGRIISLSWHPSGALIAAGMMDMIKVFNAESGHATHRLLVERGVGASKSREVVVWSVAFLSDHTIISGDSAGKVQVWDGVTGTLVRTHLVTKWDVLALSVSRDESSLLAGTSEGTVVQFQFISSTVDQHDKEWVRTRTFKNHTHDVRALAHTDTAVVSGGMDTQLVVRPLLEKVEKNTQESALRKIAFPHRSLVSCGKKAGMLLFQFHGHLELWRLGESDGHGEEKHTCTLSETHGGCQRWQAVFSNHSNNCRFLIAVCFLYLCVHVQLHCTVPVYSSCPTAMAIHPTTSNLVMVHADQQIFEYSLVQKEYTEWSRKLQKQGLHHLWLARDTPITHLTFNPRNPAHIIMHDTYMFCIIDQNLPLPDQKTLFYNQMTLRSLPEPERTSHSHSFKICKTFQHLLCVSLLEDHSLVVVERPLLDIASQLPAPVRQKKFAT